jgi:putative DNA primase/helicase
MNDHEAIAALVAGDARKAGRILSGDSAPITIGMKLTDLGNAERLVARYRDCIRYCPPRRKWLTWDGKRWAWDLTGDLPRLAKRTVRSIYGEAEHARDKDHAEAIAKHAHKSESAAQINALLKLAESEPGVAVLPDALDADPWMLNAVNCTIDLKTGVPLPHNRDHLFTKLAGAEYVPGARSELFEQFLRDATGGDADLAGYLQRAVGYALYGAVTERAFWFLYGPPAGMKSTFIAAVMAALGEYAVAADFSTWLVQTTTGGNRGDLVALVGARLVASVEVRKGARFDEAIVKKVTGGDKLKAAAKYESEIEFAPTWALWFAANDAPTIRDDDEGAWSRVRRVPFTNPLPPDRQDVRMREKLAAPEVRTAVLAWAVEGCLAWQRDGLGSCKAVTDSTSAYRAEMDRAGGFLDGECEFDPHARVTSKAMREAYETWCAEQGVKPLSGKDLAARLRERGAEIKRSGRERSYQGVRLCE